MGPNKVLYDLDIHAALQPKAIGYGNERVRCDTFITYV